MEKSEDRTTHKQLFDIGETQAFTIPELESVITASKESLKQLTEERNPEAETLQTSITKLKNLRKEFDLRVIEDRFCDILKSAKTVDDSNDVESNISLSKITCSLSLWYGGVEYDVEKDEVRVDQWIPAMAIDLNDIEDGDITYDFCVLVAMQEVYDKTGVKPQLKDGGTIVMPIIKGLQYDKIKCYVDACSEAYAKVFWINSVDRKWFWSQVAKAKENFHIQKKEAL